MVVLSAKLYRLVSVSHCKGSSLSYTLQRPAITTVSPSWNQNYFYKKANLRDLIAATGLVILLKLTSNHRFFSHGTLKFYWWPRKIIAHLFYITSSFVHHLKPLGEFELQLLSGNVNSGQNRRFLPRVTLKFNRWPWKTIGILFRVTLSFAHHFKAIGEFKLKLQSGNAQFGPKWAIFLPRVTLQFDG